MSATPFARSRLSGVPIVPDSVLEKIQGSDEAARYQRLTQRSAHVQRRQRELTAGRQAAQAEDRSAMAEAMLQDSKAPASKVDKLDKELAALQHEEEPLVVALHRAVGDVWRRCRPMADTTADELEEQAVEQVQQVRDHVNQAIAGLTRVGHLRGETSWWRQLARGDPPARVATITPDQRVLGALNETLARVDGEEDAYKARRRQAEETAAAS